MQTMTSCWADWAAAGAGGRKLVSTGAAAPELQRQTVEKKRRLLSQVSTIGFGGETAMAVRDGNLVEFLHGQTINPRHA